MHALFLIFVLVPVAEMWLLITVGNHLGALPTIGLVLLTAVAGAGLLREQGFATLWKGRQKLQGGELPTTEIAEGIISVKHSAPHLGDIPHFNEAFLTSSSRGIIPVIEINNMPIGDNHVGIMTKRLQGAYQVWLNNNLKSL